MFLFFKDVDMFTLRLILSYLLFKEAPALSGKYSKYHTVVYNFTKCLIRNSFPCVIMHHFCCCFLYPGSFWHITDQHWDPTYKLTDNAELVCASSGKRPAANAGMFGDYVCDSPWHLINSSVYAMKDILPDPDFIVWTGYVL